MSSLKTINYPKPIVKNSNGKYIIFLLFPSKNLPSPSLLLFREKKKLRKFPTSETMLFSCEFVFPFEKRIEGEDRANDSRYTYIYIRIYIYIYIYIMKIALRTVLRLFFFSLFFFLTRRFFGFPIPRRLMSGWNVKLEC